MVSRKWIGEGNGRRSYKREDAGGRGAGWLRKGFGFKRSPSTRPDQTTTTRTDAAAARWACVGLWAVGGLLAGRLDAAPPTRARSSVLVPPPLAGALHAGWLAGSIGNLRYPALETELGHWPPCGLLDMAGPKRACAFWALGSVGHQPGGGKGQGRRRKEPPLPPNGSRVTGLQISSGQVSEIC